MDSLPQSVRQFSEGLTTLYPDVEVTLEKGGKSSGVWWINIATSETHVVVQWHPEQGFRLEEVSDEEPVYGSLPSESYRSVELALKRMTQLLDENSDVTVGAVSLRDLRELHGLSQSALALRLGKGQAAVSRVERRSELRVDTLNVIVKALGGQLEIRAKFANCDLPLDLELA